MVHSIDVIAKSISYEMEALMGRRVFVLIIDRMGKLLYADSVFNQNAKYYSELVKNYFDYLPIGGRFVPSPTDNIIVFKVTDRVIAVLYSTSGTVDELLEFEEIRDDHAEDIDNYMESLKLSSPNLLKKERVITKTTSESSSLLENAPIKKQPPSISISNWIVKPTEEEETSQEPKKEEILTEEPIKEELLTQKPKKKLLLTQLPKKKISSKPKPKKEGLLLQADPNTQFNNRPEVSNAENIRPSQLLSGMNEIDNEEEELKNDRGLLLHANQDEDYKRRQQEISNAQNVLPSQILSGMNNLDYEEDVIEDEHKPEMLETSEVELPEQLGTLPEHAPLITDLITSQYGIKKRIEPPIQDDQAPSPALIAALEEEPAEELFESTQEELAQDEVETEDISEETESIEVLEEVITL